MTTKERILKESLTLFSEKGYSDVSVGEIAGAVGIKAPSLYKHYKNKQEIFDSCVNKFFEGMTLVRNRIYDQNTSKDNKIYENADIDKIVEISIGLFMFYLKDDVALVKVNPAYSSFIAKTKYMKLKGMSIHHGAAYVLARRGMGYSESYNHKEMNNDDWKKLRTKSYKKTSGNKNSTNNWGLNAQGWNAVHKAIIEAE